MADADELLMTALEQAEALTGDAQELNRSMRDGFMGITEARYGSRWNKINQFSFPTVFEPRFKVVLRPGLGGGSGGGGGAAASKSGEPEWVLVAVAGDADDDVNGDGGSAAGTVGAKKGVAAGSPAGLRQRRGGGGAKDATTTGSSTSRSGKAGGSDSGRGGDDDNDDSGSQESSSSSPTTGRESVDNTDPRRDPLQWFVLPPPALKRAQEAFAAAMGRVPRMATAVVNLTHTVRAFGELVPVPLAAPAEEGDAAGRHGKEEEEKES
jgi:hypothetical protein